MQQVAQEMNQAVRQHLRSRSKHSPVHTNRASELGHPCSRYVCYVRVAWQDRELPDETLQVIFDDGNMHERYVIRLLEDVGYNVQEQQIPFEWKEYSITGHLDAVLYIEDIGQVVAEMKSTNDHTYQTLNCAADFLNGQWWVKKWYGQLQLYLLLKNLDNGLFILKDKSPMGRFPLKFIPVALDYEYAEGLLRKAEMANKVVAAVEKQREMGMTDPADLDRLLPDRIEPDEKICGRCSFIHRCMGQRTFGPELVILTDEQISAKVIRREELKPFSKEYKDVHDGLRQAIINAGGNVISGDYHLTIGGRNALKVDKVK